MARLIEYLRVSSEKQKKEGYGFIEQDDDVKLFCRLNGHEAVHPLRDDYPGMKPLAKRPEGCKIADLLQSGRADGVVFPKINRLGRSFVDIITDVRDLIKGGYPLYSADHGLIPNELDLPFIIRAWEAQTDHDDIVKRTMNGRRNKAKSGQWVCQGGRRSTPYGYSTIGKGKEAVLVVDMALAQIVIEIHERYSTGTTATIIANDLNKRHVPPARSKEWNRGMILAILTNPFYTGQVHYADVKYHDPKLQIISDELAQAVKAKIAENRKYSPKNYDYLVSRGRLLCVCGSQMTGSGAGGSASGSRSHDYVCWRHNTFRVGDPRRCDVKRLKSDDVEQTFIMWLLSIGLFRDSLERLVSEMTERAEAELQPLRGKLQELDETIADTKQQIDNLVAELAKTKNKSVIASVETHLDKLAALSDDLVARREKTQSEIDAYGAWSGPIDVDAIQAELVDLWSFEATSPSELFEETMSPEYWQRSGYNNADQWVTFDWSKINRDKARRIIKKYDLRGKLVTEDDQVKLKISCRLNPQGESVAIGDNGLGAVNMNVSELARRLSVSRWKWRAWNTSGRSAC